MRNRDSVRTQLFVGATVFVLGAALVAFLGLQGHNDPVGLANSDVVSHEASTTTETVRSEESAGEVQQVFCQNGDTAPSQSECPQTPATVAAELDEWFVGVPTALSSGAVTFDIVNTGEFPHALAIARGPSYEDLPLLDNGAVDTDALGTDFVGSTSTINPGTQGSGEFQLGPGEYVFFCPIQIGPNSHAAAGQVQSVTVG